MNDYYMMSIPPAVTDKPGRTPDLGWTNQLFSPDNLELGLRACEVLQGAENTAL